MIIEVLGSDSRDRADTLAEKLKTIFQNQTKVVRPMVRGEIRLNGECKEEETKAGPIRKMNNGLFTVWVQCPLSAAIKMANRKKVRIGWTLARVDLLEDRPVQCFKCWRFGHVRLTCTSTEDDSGLCFKCGGTGHLARECDQPPSCKICVSEGKNFNHRIGSYLCTAKSKVVKTRNNFRQSHRIETALC
ncbi:uncharacterized protein [Polyergus mexicanus]|uniref:uncharacterized protein n=1 Tax=Polyergus mexicanus TaxID=615972 RepID=UPI0038B58521